MNVSRLSRGRRWLAGDSSLALVIRNAGWLLLGKGFGAVLSLVYLAMTTRILGPQQFGQFTLVVGTAQAVAAFMSFQSWQLVIRFGHGSNARADTAASRRLFAFCLALDIVTAIIGCAVAVGVVIVFADYFGWSRDLAWAALALTIIMLLSVRSTALGILRLYDKFREGAAAASMTPLVRFAGAIAAWLLAPNLIGFLGAWMAAEIATAAAYWWLAARHSGPILRDMKLPVVTRVPGEHPGLYRFAAVTNLGSTMTAVAQQLPLLTLGFFAGPVAAGLFRLAYQLSQALSQLSQMLSRSLFAEFSKLHARTDTDARQKLMRQTRRLTLLAGVIVIAIAALIGRPALILIAGPEYAGAFPLLVILAMAAAIEMASVSFEPDLMARGRAMQALGGRALAAAGLAVSMAVLLPPLGAQGAAFSVLVYSLISYLALAALSRRQ